MNIDIEKIKRKLLIKYPLFGSIVANAEFIERPSIGTAGTNGKQICYNTEFVETLSEEEQIFLFGHEIGHIAFNHIFRSEGKDKKIWNIATDAVINAFLQKDGLPILEGSVDMPEAINYDAETLYQKLLEEKSDNQQNGKDNNENTNQENSSSNSNNDMNKTSSSDFNSSLDDSNQGEENKEENTSDSRNDVGHDTHSMWDEAVKEAKEKNLDDLKQREEKEDKTSKESEDQEKDKSEEKKENIFQKIASKMNGKKKTSDNQQKAESDYPDRSEEKENKIKEEIKRLSSLGEKESFKQNRIEKQKRLEELRQTLASESHGAGVGTNKEERKVENIGVASPLIDWRRLLKEAVKYDIDWSYKNASIEDGVVTPYLEDIPMPETEILLDTSGSISETLLRNFLRECKNILQTSKVKVGCFDDEFYGFTEIRNENDIDNMEFIGGGGTNFNVAVNAFTRRVENKIIFTDGEASIPNKSIDAIWIVFGERKINPPGGKVIYIDEEALEKLLSCYIVNDFKSRTR